MTDWLVVKMADVVDDVIMDLDENEDVIPKSPEEWVVHWYFYSLISILVVAKMNGYW